MPEQLLSRDAVEEFLYREAELLDDWRLPEWAELFTADARYDIASLDADDPASARSDTSLFVLADDRQRIASRAKRLMKKTAHAEYPHSKTRHITSNVRLGAVNGNERSVKANFVVYRTKGEKTAQYMGEARYVLVEAEGVIRIRHKRCILDLNSLFDQGRLTIIL
jgi:p-cumate 2,3-dioxygenase subunit beta